MIGAGIAGLAAAITLRERGHDVTAAEFTSGKGDKPGDDRYGFGFADETVRAHRIVGHAGGFPGINSNLDIFWDEDWVVAVMSNVDMGAMPVQNMARQLIAR